MFRFVLVACLVGLCAEARAQNAAADDWTVTAYPIFAWLPVDIGRKVDVSGGDGVSSEIYRRRLQRALSEGHR